MNNNFKFEEGFDLDRIYKVLAKDLSHCDYSKHTFKSKKEFKTSIIIHCRVLTLPLKDCLIIDVRDEKGILIFDKEYDVRELNIDRFISLKQFKEMFKEFII